MSESDGLGETLGYQLRRPRRCRGMTQEELTDRVNLSRDLVAKLEQGRRHSARISSLASFARALDVELSALVGGATPVLETEASEVDRDMPELSLAPAGCQPHDAASVVDRLLGEDAALSLAGIARRPRVRAAALTMLGC